MTASRIIFAAIVGFCSVSAFAQIPSPQPGTTTQDTAAPGAAATTDQTAQPADQSNPSRIAKDPGKTDPGSVSKQKKGTAPAQDTTVTDLDKTPTGPMITDDQNLTPEQKASAEYSGPAILSRGITSSRPMNPQNVKLTPQGSVEYLINSGMTGTTLQQDGTLKNDLSSGIQVNYGITGTKLLKKDIVSLTFGGSFYHYTANSAYDGSNNSLELTWSHEVNKRIKIGLRESAIEFSQNNLLNSGSDVISSGLGTTLVSASPATEVFDGRVFSLMTEGDVTYRWSPRLSFNLTGGGFLTRRNSSSLYGVTGSQATGDAVYRFTRRVSAGVYYGYTHFDFTRIYGATDVHSVGVTYSIAFDRRTELVTRIGVSRLETTGVESITVDPLIAALLGTNTVPMAVYRINHAPDISVRLQRTLNNFSLSGEFNRGVTPGDGIILTSVRQTAALGLNYRTRRRWNMAAMSGYDTLSGFGTTNQRYQSVYYNASVYRTIRGNLSWHARLDFHHYLFDNTGFLRNSVVASTGVAWTPGDLLSRLW